MNWLSSPRRRERRLAARRERRLRQALQLYGFNDGDGVPTEGELEQERNAALVELLRDFGLFFGAPDWGWLEDSVNDAAWSESARVTQAGGNEFYATTRAEQEGAG